MPTMTISDWLLVVNAVLVSGFWISLLRWTYRSRKELAALEKSLQELEQLAASGTARRSTER